MPWSAFWVGDGGRRRWSSAARCSMLLPAHAHRASARQLAERAPRAPSARCFRNPQSILCGVDRRPAVHPDHDLRHDLGRALPAGGARLRLRRGGDALGDRAARLDHRLSAARLHLRPHRPAQAGDRRRRRWCCSPASPGSSTAAPACCRRTCSAWSRASRRARRCCRTRSSRKPIRRSTAAPPPASSTSSTSRSARCSGPVFGGASCDVSGGAAQRWRSSTTRRRSSRSCYGVALAIVLTFLLKETGPAAAARPGNACEAS